MAFDPDSNPRAVVKCIVALGLLLFNRRIGENNSIDDAFTIAEKFTARVEQETGKLNP